MSKKPDGRRRKLDGYRPEPRLAFNRIVAVRYRMHLESGGLAANIVNQPLAAGPGTGSRHHPREGGKQLALRSGNWLSAERGSEGLKHAYGDGMRAKRDYAMLAMLFGCGFRGSELVGSEFDEVQMRQGHWQWWI